MHDCRAYGLWKKEYPFSVSKDQTQKAKLERMLIMLAKYLYWVKILLDINA